MTASVPAGPTDAQARLREVLRAHVQVTPRQCLCGEREPFCAGLHDPTWHVEHLLALPTVRDALAAQETVTAVRELHTRDATVPYACEYCGQAWPCDVIHALNTAGDS